MKIKTKELSLLLIGMFIVSISIYYIMIPSGLVIGTLTGFVLVLSHFIPLSISTLTLIMNFILLALGFCFIGKEFGSKTVLTSLLLPFYLRVFEIITPTVPQLTSNLFVNAVCFVIVISIGQTMLFNANASSGGLDIMAKLINKFFHIELGKSLALSGIIVSATSILVYDREILVISLLGTYLGGIVLDRFMDGSHMRKRVSIISPEYAEIQEFVVKKLNRGVTLYSARGGWDNSERVTLVTILQKNEYARLLAYVNQIDPKAFITVSTVGEVIGQWNPHIKKLK